MMRLSVVAVGKKMPELQSLVRLGLLIVSYDAEMKACRISMHSILATMVFRLGPGLSRSER